MNVVFLSPHFPPIFQNFSNRLRRTGANVLGLADASYESLTDELRGNLTEYYRVNDLHNYDEVVRAIGYFTHKYGKIDRVDSLNEYWLEMEARIRTDFNVFGYKENDIDMIKRKSGMKRLFQKIGLKCARGRVCQVEKEFRAFVKDVGYPVVAKPDIGVGAAATYKIENDDQLAEFLASKTPEDFIVEEFIDAPIITWDGLTDRSGDLAFVSSMRYSRGIMETVNEDSDVYYYCVRDIEPALDESGREIVRAFDLKERFFHFEFFHLENGTFMPLEVNMRPPGGLTPDMFNYANDFDCYQAWAEVLTTGESTQKADRPYFVIYVGRKDRIGYARSHEQVLEEFKDLIVHSERLSDVFSRAIGNYGYLLRHPDLEPLTSAAKEIQKRS